MKVSCAQCKIKHQQILQWKNSFFFCGSWKCFKTAVDATLCSLFVRNVAAYLCGNLFHGSSVVVSTVLWCPTDSVVVDWGICTDNIIILTSQSKRTIAVWSRPKSPKKENKWHSNWLAQTYPWRSASKRALAAARPGRTASPHPDHHLLGFLEQGWWLQAGEEKIDVILLIWMSMTWRGKWYIHKYDIQRWVVKWTIALGPLSCVCRQ